MTPMDPHLEKRMDLDHEQFVECFPFYLGWDADFAISCFGPSLAKICQDVRVAAISASMNAARPNPPCATASTTDSTR